MKYRKAALTTYAVLAHLTLALFVYLYWLELKPNIETRTQVNPYVSCHLRNGKYFVDGSIIFFGDSITEGLDVRSVVVPSENYGIGGTKTNDLLVLLPKYKMLSRAGGIVLAIGINDLRVRAIDEIAADYDAILRALPNDIPVLASSVLPIDENTSFRRRHHYTNKDVAELNRKIHKICTANSNCTYVDSHYALTDDSGNLKAEYHRGDGIHLNRKGYQQWSAVLHEALRAINAGEK